MTEPRIPPSPGSAASPATPDPAAPTTAAPGAAAAQRIERRSRFIGTKRAFRAIKAEHSSELRPLERIADTLTRIASSTPFLVFHALWFFVWISYNSKYVGQAIFGFEPFDPFPFGLLTMVVSLEAIFLSIFVLLSQSRESAIGELREELNLQVNLRIEEEVTKTLQLVAGLYRRMGYELAEDPELREMMQPLDAKAIERQLIEQIRGKGIPPREQPIPPAPPATPPTPPATPGA